METNSERSIIWEKNMFLFFASLLGTTTESHALHTFFSFSLLVTLWGGYCSHFPDEETETHGCCVTCPKCPWLVSCRIRISAQFSLIAWPLLLCPLPKKRCKLRATGAQEKEVRKEAIPDGTVEGGHILLPPSPYTECWSMQVLWHRWPRSVPSYKEERKPRDGKITESQKFPFYLISNILPD